MPKLYIIAGCNGAGKTEASNTVLPEMLQCQQFVNADEIAKGLSPFNPESVALEAGRIMLRRMDELLEKQADFAFETTLATRSYAKFIEEAQLKGYFVVLLFFWLPSPEHAMERVALRVKKGGHNIPEDVIRRRYENGLKNLMNIYLSLCDSWYIYDNSSTKNKALVASGRRDLTQNIENQNVFSKIKYYGNR